MGASGAACGARAGVSQRSGRLRGREGGKGLRNAVMLWGVELKSRHARIAKHLGNGWLGVILRSVDFEIATLLCTKMLSGL